MILARKMRHGLHSMLVYKGLRAMTLDAWRDRPASASRLHAEDVRGFAVVLQLAHPQHPGGHAAAFPTSMSARCPLTLALPDVSVHAYGS